MKKKQDRGITLIALVITIIIMLILAGITINVTIGEKGILKRAQVAGKNYIYASQAEENELEKLTDKTDKIIVSATQNIDVEVQNLKPGDYIKYDTGNISVGENGIIACRVLYPATSKYGLQIISIDGVGDKIILNQEKNWTSGKNAYNNLKIVLNNEAEKYINKAYVSDARCVGSFPDVQHEKFVNKNSGAKTIFTLPDSYQKPTTWETKETGLYEMDESYVMDITQIKNSKINSKFPNGEGYYLASRHLYELNSSKYRFSVRRINSTGAVDILVLCEIWPNRSDCGLCC